MPIDSPVHLRPTAGQVADCTKTDALTEDLGERASLLADKGYDSNAIHAKAVKRKAWANILPKANRRDSFILSSWVYRLMIPLFSASDIQIGDRDLRYTYIRQRVVR